MVRHEIQMQDIIIIGAGVAGLTAGIYARRGNLKTLLLEGAFPGGQAFTIDLVENWPGFPAGVRGGELSELVFQQAQNLGVEIVYQSVVKLEKIADGFKVVTGQEEYQARSLIIATGALPKKLGVPGEAEFYQKGVSYCATCDGALYRNKKVAVIGGGNTAIQEGLFLANLAAEVFVIHRRNEFRAAPLLVERAKAKSNLSFITDTVVKEIRGEQTVKAVLLENVKTKDESLLDLDGVFVYVGFTPQSLMFKDFLECDENGYLLADEEMRTSMPGVFAAGDIRKKSLRQLITAAADGAIAAVNATNYLLSGML